MSKSCFARSVALWWAAAFVILKWKGVLDGGGGSCCIIFLMVLMKALSMTIVV